MKCKYFKCWMHISLYEASRVERTNSPLISFKKTPFLNTLPCARTWEMIWYLLNLLFSQTENQTHPLSTWVKGEHLCWYPKSDSLLESSSSLFWASCILNTLESHTSTYSYVIQGSWLLNTESHPKFGLSSLGEIPG